VGHDRGETHHPQPGELISTRCWGLFGWAAARFDASKATGLDGAVHTIVEAPFGRVLLTVVALGIGAFGLFSLLRARYPSRT